MRYDESPAVPCSGAGLLCILLERFINRSNRFLMNFTRRLILSAAALMLLVPSVSAQDDKGKKVDYTGTQELDISVGLPYGPLFRDASIVGDAFAGFNFISPSDIVTGENKTVLPTFRAEYGYNVLSWLSLGAGVNYSYGSYRMLYKEDNSHAWDEWTSGKRGGGRRMLHPPAADI